MKVVSSFGITEVIPHSCKSAICRTQGLGVRDKQVVRDQKLGIRGTISLLPGYLPLATKQGAMK